MTYCHDDQYQIGQFPTEGVDDTEDADDAGGERSGEKRVFPIAEFMRPPRICA
jgi:hypothetical protein